MGCPGMRGGLQYSGVNLVALLALLTAHACQSSSPRSGDQGRDRPHPAGSEAASDQRPSTPNTSGAPDHLYQAGGWELKVTYVNKGTRSEGLHGVLLHQGQVVEADELGEVVDTELGRMEYFGDKDKVERPWDPRGWLFVDRERWPEPSWRE